jgi:peptidoglycan/LPS O-acetylase OafA/YrhL
MPRELRYLGQSIAGVGVFASNFVFWRKSGYFAADEETIPLLHSWSLAVEEQYYLVFPAILLLLASAGPLLRSFVIGLISLVSLVLSILWSKSAPDAAYYLLPSRGFELMIGALLALNPPRMTLSPLVADLMAFAGLVLVLGAIIGFSDATPFPGIAALIPCLGTALLIRAGAPTGSLSGAMLQWKPIVGLGKLSYSLYLWHWPIIVFWALYQRKPIGHPMILEVVGLFITSLLLAYASYRWIESPVRERRLFATRRSLMTASIASLLLLFTAGTFLHVFDGAPQRLPDSVRNVTAVIGDWTDPQLRCGDLGAETEPCRIGVPTGKIRFVMWGDSHAQALFNAAEEASVKAGVGGLHLSRGACPPLPGIGTGGTEFNQGCPAFNESAISRIESLRPDVVILVARWNAYLADEHTIPAVQIEGSIDVALRNVVRRITRAGARVLLFDEVPYPKDFEPSSFATGMWRFGLDPDTLGFNRAELHSRRALWEKTLIDAEVNGLLRIDPARTLCNEDWCPVFRDDLPLYRDSNHLTNYAARLLVPELAGVLRELTCQATACREDDLDRAP